MTEPTDEELQAQVRPRRWVAWVWIVPAVAAGIVLWLAWRSLAERGPEITISFTATHGLQAGESTVQHRGVVVGTVRSLELTKDMSRVLVHVRMTRAASDALNENARFYIVAPRVSAAGISGLTTLVSGSYIELYPGKDGGPRREFMGLEDPPLLETDTNGKSYTLIADELGSLTRGATVSYRGIDVGEVSGFVLGPDSKSVRVTIFVRAPYDKLVHPQTHFWNAGGLDVTLGAQGARIRSNSWQQLLSGGVEFETPLDSLTGEPAAENSVFSLYENERRARRDPRTEPLIYVSTFPDGARELEPGAAVELKGMEVGSVKSAQLAYNEKRRTLETLVTFEIDPMRVDILDIPAAGTSDPHAKVANWIERLKRDGLHAQVTNVNLITGRQIVSLDIVGGPNTAKTERRQGHELIPSSSSGDLNDTLASLKKVLDNLDRATSGPELGHAIKSLDNTLTRLDAITRDVQPDLKSLVKSLRETADAAQKTMTSVQGTLGNAGSNGTDVAELMRELKDAARSVRGLADYLDRHPEALIRGRKDEK